jgi:hypothetical protein
MKTPMRILIMLLVSLLILGCGMINFKGVNLITPSDTIITETRPVADFSNINLSTFGKMVITQGETVALTITGADNLVPLVETSVDNGVLTIRMDEDIDIRNLDKENVLTYDITVKDLAGLTVSGLGDVEMSALNTNNLNVTMSGAGQIKLGQLFADTLDVTLSGLGNVEVAGEATKLVATISGAGALEAGDLKCQTAEVSIPGLGSATVWVTDSLTGEISGGGNVSYYGDPQLSFETTGLGNFKPLGDK